MNSLEEDKKLAIETIEKKSHVILSFSGFFGLIVTDVLLAVTGAYIAVPMLIVVMKVSLALACIYVIYALITAHIQHRKESKAEIERIQEITEEPKEKKGFFSSMFSNNKAAA